MGFESIPLELRRLAQWVVWRDENGVKHPINVHTGHFASVNKPDTWATFEQCVAASKRSDLSGIGFVLTESDDYAFIDLDYANGDATARILQQQVCTTFNSYAEISPSGKGLHIIVKGNVPSGRRRHKVEVYSSLRYMTMTGNVHWNKPIVDCGQALESLWGHLGKSNGVIECYTGDSEASYSDNEVHAMALRASNGEKYDLLFKGVWQGLYQSQSEADFALIDILAYYTQSKEQIVRMFRTSYLGKRPKAKRKDYVGWMLNRAFDRLPPPINLDAIYNQTQALVAQLREEQEQAAERLALEQAAEIERQRELQRLDVEAKQAARLDRDREAERQRVLAVSGQWPGLPNLANRLQPTAAVGAVASSNEHVNGHAHVNGYAHYVNPNGSLVSISDVKHSYDYLNQPVLYTNPAYQFPEGLIGDIATYIYKSSPRPIAEVALMGAIGLMAGISGRSYTISNTGLNMYGVILAKTGNGKEALASGISKLINVICESVPAASEFAGFGDAASSQGLLRYMASSNTKSFVVVSKEFGQYLEMSGRKGNSSSNNMQGIFRTLLDLYNLSGPNQVLRSSAYSHVERNTSDIQSPALTFIGESTPTKFYNVLSENVVSEGLIPRFMILDYKGKKPPLNEHCAKVYPDNALIQSLATLAAHCLALSKSNQRIEVKLDDTAYRLMKDFSGFIDAKQNLEDLRDVELELWSRTHFKALRLAALVAVGVNFVSPIITESMATWAIAAASADAHNMQTRFTAGDIGQVETDETKQVISVKAAIKRWIVGNWQDVAANTTGSYGAKLHEAKIIPYAYLSNRLHNLAAFKNDKIGASKAIKRAIDILCDNGDISKINTLEMLKAHGTGQMGYAVENARILE